MAEKMGDMADLSAIVMNPEREIPSPDIIREYFEWGVCGQWPSKGGETPDEARAERKLGRPVGLEERLASTALFVETVFIREDQCGIRVHPNFRSERVKSVRSQQIPDAKRNHEAALSGKDRFFCFEPAGVQRPNSSIFHREAFDSLRLIRVLDVPAPIAIGLLLD